ncbi:MAG: DMT family transporter [Holosporales bacterium]
MSSFSANNGKIAQGLSWFRSKGYLQGVFWILIVSLISNMNDILMRVLGHRLPPFEITFCRYFFAAFTLIPFMAKGGVAAFKTPYLKIHGLRSLLLFGAIACWATGVTMVPLAVVSTMALTVPLFVLPMAYVFLGETVGWQRTLATLAGFAGIMVVVTGEAGTTNWWHSFISGSNGTLYLLCAAVLFALSDIVNKKMVVQESSLSMLFFIAIGTALIGLYPALQVWVHPTWREIGLLFLLGSGANLILFFLLKAFAATDVSALAPFRYAELIFASFFGFIFFSETLDQWHLLGMGIIIPSTFAIAYYETHKAKH